MKLYLSAALAVLGCAAAPSAAPAEDQSFALTLKDHRFSPAELTIPANTRVRLVVRNADPTAAEFESDDVKAEKVLPANHETVVLIGPLQPGSYEFHDEYHEASSQSRLIVR